MNLRPSRLQNTIPELLVPTPLEKSTMDRRLPAALAWQHDEHLLQKSIMIEMRLLERSWPELSRLHAIPNGGQRSKGVAGKMKAEGQKSGVPDLFLPVPRAGFPGFYIELKKAGGVPSANQWDWMTFLYRAGYVVGLFNSPKEVVNNLIGYLALPKK